MIKQGSLISHLLAAERSGSQNRAPPHGSQPNEFGSEAATSQLRQNKWQSVFGSIPDHNESSQGFEVAAANATDPAAVVNPFWESIISRATGAGLVEAARQQEDEPQNVGEVEGAAERTVSLKGHYRTSGPSGASTPSTTPMSSYRSVSKGVVRSRPSTPQRTRKPVRSASSSVSPSANPATTGDSGSYYMYLVNTRSNKIPNHAQSTREKQHVDPLLTSPVSSEGRSQSLIKDCDFRNTEQIAKSSNAKHEEDPLSRRLKLIQQQLQSKSEEVVQETARDDFINAQRADELIECCATVQHLLAIEISHRKNTDERLAARIDKLIAGGLEGRVRSGLDASLQDLENSLSLMGSRLRTISDDMYALSQRSEAAIHRFCGGVSEEATARKNELVDIFNAVGEETEARMQLEAKFSHDAQAEFLGVARKLETEAEGRNTKLNAYHRSLEGLQISALGAAMEGEGGDIFVSTTLNPLLQDKDSSVFTFPTTSTLRSIHDVKIIVGRLGELLTQASLERSANHNALGGAIAVAAQRRGLRV